MSRHNGEQGVTAIFLVIFAAILLSVITISFAQMMVREQANSLDNVLSQAAYDSATAGVEDAKRTIIACRNGNNQACNAIDAKACDTNYVVTSTPRGQETLIQTSSGGGADLAQAYTCVKINMNRPDILRSVNVDQPIMIPLRAVGQITGVSIEWQQKGDLGGTVDTSQLGQFASACHRSAANLCSTDPVTGWGSAPALLSAQFILPNTPFKLVDLDANNLGQTLYLRPFNIGAATTSLTVQPQRYTPSAAPIATGNPNLPTPAICNAGLGSSYTGGGYACKIMIGGLNIPAGSAVSFLRLSAFYRGAAVKVTFYNGASTVGADGVQADVDSTGRANDVYRRIDSRLEFGDDSTFPLPQNAVDLGGSLCKDFGITTTGITTPSSCTP